ncbi:MAG: helix-turn-helix domain-containing protein [Magnetococcales bacterium]|nr:helix-turn-helix domain-containing protein [Magnetococcales bacterium]MBF0583688.1 helix-turn-helix domain-containing protein [Magnetococcales bacterium]
MNPIKALRYATGATQEEIAELIGGKSDTISAMERGKQRIYVEMLTKLSKHYRITDRWVMTDEGMELRAEPVIQNTNQREGMIYVPEYSMVEASAGDGCHVDNEFADDFIAFREDFIQDLDLDRKKVAVIRVRGDSMHPTLSSGDLILIDRRDCVEFSDDAIYVFNLEGEVFVKRIQRVGRGQIEILSDNPRYKSRVPGEHELETLRIIGRVVWAGGRV